MILLQLFWNFLVIGAVSFGGGYGMISLVRETVLGHGWLTESEFLSFIAVSESTPGPLAVVLAGFYKDGKRYVDCQNSRRYRLYSRVWVALYPVRPLIMFVHKGCGWIRRHIFKRGERS